MEMICCVFESVSKEDDNCFNSSENFNQCFLLSAMMESILLLAVRISVYTYGRLIMTAQSSHQQEEIEMNTGKELKVFITILYTLVT